MTGSGKIPVLAWRCSCQVSEFSPVFCALNSCMHCMTITYIEYRQAHSWRGGILIQTGVTFEFAHFMIPIYAPKHPPKSIICSNPPLFTLVTLLIILDTRTKHCPREKFLIRALSCLLLVMMALTSKTNNHWASHQRVNVNLSQSSCHWYEA